jgi:hypothetical protein
MNYLITEYNKLRFVFRLSNPPEYIIKLLNHHQLTRGQIETAHLPTIANELNIKIESIRLEYKAIDIVKYCIQEFCSLCLNLLKYKHQATDRTQQALDTHITKMVHEFTIYNITTILKSDELLTKPGWFNWTIIYGDKTDKQYDPNTDKELEDKSSDKEKEDDDITETTPFSNDGFDIEDGFNDDGDDLEVRVVNDIDDSQA